MKRRVIVGSLLVAAALIAATGVTTQTQQKIATPATVVGADTCLTCHQQMAEQFKRSAHGHLAEFERSGQPTECESCHGPGSRHAESGDPTDIRSFRDATGRDASSSCMTCHQKDQAINFAASQHAVSQVGCANCHTIHQSRQVQPGLMTTEGRPALHGSAPAPRGSLKQREPELCFQCHNEKRAKFWSASHHPVREGYMTCSSCHEVHGAGQDNALLKSDERVNDLCHTCHASKQGPFVFEHPPVEESCDGHHQSLTTNHCSNCHTVGYTQKVDQKTRDLAAGLRMSRGSVTIDYSFLRRTFGEDAATLTHVYDRAVHPATLLEAFYNRVQYDQRDGASPFDTTPGGDKTTHTFNARVGLPKEATLTGLFVHSSASNADLDLRTTYTGGSGRFVVPLNKRLTFRGSLRSYDVESDSVFVNVADTVSPAGPAAGLIYEQAYPSVGELSFLRESALSRRPTDFSLELAYQPWKHTTLRMVYDWESISRDHFEVGKTTTQTLRIAGRGRVNKAFDWRFRLDREWVADPFAYEHAAIPQTLRPFPSPGNLPFTGLQYYEMYRSRQADLTSFPTASTFVDGTATWIARVACHRDGALSLPDGIERGAELLDLEQRRSRTGPGGLGRARRSLEPHGRLYVPAPAAGDDVQHARLRWLSGRHHDGPVWLADRPG